MLSGGGEINKNKNKCFSSLFMSGFKSQSVFNILELWVQFSPKICLFHLSFDDLHTKLELQIEIKIFIEFNNNSFPAPEVTLQ